MVFTEFTEIDAREAFLHSTTDERLLDEIKIASNLVVTSVKVQTLTPEKLKKMFKNIKENRKRDSKIFEACQCGYSQHAIAQCLGLSQPYIHKIVKRERNKSLQTYRYNFTCQVL